MNSQYLSDIVAIVLNARISDRSGLDPRFCQRSRDDDKKSLVVPFGLEITVDNPPSERSGLVGPPTRTWSLSPDSLAKVRHSEVSSIECDSNTRPHSEHTVSPAEWSNTTSVFFLQSEQYTSPMSKSNLSSKLIANVKQKPVFVNGARSKKGIGYGFSVRIVTGVSCQLAWNLSIWIERSV